jgi:hypothetical protein
MSSQYKGRMAELYAEFDQVIDKLTYKELLWLVCFVQGYHAGNSECLSIICADDELHEDIRSEAVYSTNSGKRTEPNLNRKRKLKHAYTELDYSLESISPEDALIEAIDSLNQEFAA